MKLAKGQIYLIHWEDTFCVNSWRCLDEIKELAEGAKGYIKTIGFYIGKFENFETFSGCLNTNPEMSDWGTITYIPIGCIKKIQKLKE